MAALPSLESDVNGRFWFLLGALVGVVVIVVVFVGAVHGTANVVAAQQRALAAQP